MRAQQAWVMLGAHVKYVNKPLTYGELAKQMGLGRRGPMILGPILTIIGRYCIENELPALNCIVIAEETKTPGPGVVSRYGDWKRDQRDALKTDWFQFRVPTTGTLRQVWEEGDDG